MIKYNGLTSNLQYYRGNKIYNLVKGGPRTPSRSEYFTLENIASTQAQFYLCVFNGDIDISNSVSISTDGTNWSTLTWSNEVEWFDRGNCKRSLITIPAGGKVMFKTLKDIHNVDSYPQTKFSFSTMVRQEGLFVDSNTGEIVCYGNPMSLWAVNFQTFDNFQQGAIESLFGNYVYLSTNVVDASGLWLGDIDVKLQHGAMYNAFYNCYNLMYPPQLPCINFNGDYQYNSMFRNTGILYAPDLPAIKINGATYQSMFADCRNMTKGPVFGGGKEVISTEAQCFNNMFDGCSNLSQIPDAAITFMNGEGNGVFSNVFNGCSSLTDLSGFHVKILSDLCYDGMGNLCYGCSSLVHAPYIEIFGIMRQDEVYGPDYGKWNFALNNAFVGCPALTDIVIISNPQDSVWSANQIYDGGENPPTPANCRFICGVGANWIEGTEHVETPWEHEIHGYPQGWTVERRNFGNPTTVSIDAQQ